jgi:hypothetical protein
VSTLGPVWIQSILEFQKNTTTVLQNTLVLVNTGMFGCNQLCSFKTVVLLKVQGVLKNYTPDLFFLNHDFS